QPAIINAVGSLDVDIILDEGPDVINMMTDTFDVLSGMIQNGQQIPFEVLIELAPIQSSVKRKIKGLMQQQGQDPAAAQAKAIALATAAAELRNTTAEAANIESHTMQRRATTIKEVGQAAKAASDAHANANQIERDAMGLAPATQPAQQVA